MPKNMQLDIREILHKIIENPSLNYARELERGLVNHNYNKIVFGGRVNQKSSIEAASESDRGVTERIANAFDASLTAARKLAGLSESDPTLTPRIAVQRFLNPNREECVWDPQYSAISFQKPIVKFWQEDKDAKLRFRRHQSVSGLCTFLVQDNSIGIARNEMPRTILNLNSESKLKTFEAIGQFGHGGSSVLAFCESCLVITRPRFGNVEDEFYWTLIFSEVETEISKQTYTRKWFADHDGLPMIGKLADFPELASVLPGTSLWHFGYDRGTWVKTGFFTHQDAPAGRLGRLFFSYPLSFEIHGEFARGETKTGKRTIKGAYFRLLEEKSGDKAVVEYRTGEKSEKLMVDGEFYGQFSLFAFVLKDRKEVRNYVEAAHPVIMTLHGQNHGETTSTLLNDAGLSELASSTIVEVRLEGLDQEALSNIINNSRENPKNTPFTRALKQRVTELLREDEALANIERRRQEERARQSSHDLNQKMTSFLSSIMSNARALPGESFGDDSPGGGGGGGGKNLRPEIPACDPPHILEFISTGSLYIPEGSAILAKIKSDARPPKYSFHGDNPRCFAKIDLKNEYAERLAITGKADINGRGYGSITLTATESLNESIRDAIEIGTLTVTIQSTDGRLLQAKLTIGLCQKPEIKQRKKQQSVEPDIRFCAPEGCDVDQLKELITEDNIAEFGTQLGHYRDSLGVPETDCAYWGEKSERDGVSKLIVEINAAHPQLRRLLKACSTAEEKIFAKERIVQDIVLDCYQHSFKLEDVPSVVHEQVMGEQEDSKRAAEICLNFDKALRIAILERERMREIK